MILVNTFLRQSAIKNENIYLSQQYRDYISADKLSIIYLLKDKKG
jgi:hypothetical protein